MPEFLLAAAVVVFLAGGIWTTVKWSIITHRLRKGETIDHSELKNATTSIAVASGISGFAMGLAARLSSIQSLPAAVENDGYVWTIGISCFFVLICTVGFSVLNVVGFKVKIRTLELLQKAKKEPD